MDYHSNMTYIVYIEVLGKKFKFNIEASTRKQAEYLAMEKVKDSAKVHDVKAIESDDMVDRLKSLFNMN